MKQDLAHIARSTRTLAQGIRLANDFSSGIVLRVWEGCHPTVRASVYVEAGATRALVADHTAGSIHERAAVAWAIRKMAANQPGFYVLFV